MERDPLTGHDEYDRTPQTGDMVRNRLTGRIYRLREIRRTTAILQRGSTAIRVRLENVELVRANHK